MKGEKMADLGLIILGLAVAYVWTLLIFYMKKKK